MAPCRNPSPTMPPTEGLQAQRNAFRERPLQILMNMIGTEGPQAEPTLQALKWNMATTAEGTWMRLLEQAQRFGVAVM